MREIDMRLAAIEAGIDMGEGDGNERAGAENFGSGEHQAHGELHGRAVGAVERGAVPVIERDADCRHVTAFSRAMRFKVT